jgi:hypothetical protein
MRPQPLAIAGIALAALALAGCGEDPGVEQGTVPFTGTNTAPLDPLSSEMKKKMQDKSYVKKSDGNGEPAAESKGAGESGPAAESRPSTESKPAGESKPTTGPEPAAESRPATKGG